MTVTAAVLQAMSLALMWRMRKHHTTPSQGGDSNRSETTSSDAKP